MSVEAAREFVDANILVYAFDSSAGKKRAAAESGCDTLWTEDLNDGQVLRGVRIRDPFSPDQTAKHGHQPKLP